MQDHDGVTVLLGRQFEERQQLIVILEVAYRSIDYLSSGRAKLCKLLKVSEIP